MKQWATWFNENVEKTGLTPDLLCLEADVSRGALNAWQSGERLPKLINMIQLCNVFADRQGRRPQTVILECLSMLDEYTTAEKKWKNKQIRKGRRRNGN